MGRLFGTDGIRGLANRDLSIERASGVGVALAMVLRERLGRRPAVLIGKDTRRSSDMLEMAVAAGLCAGGADVVLIGVAPTPAVAWLTPAKGADGGVMITASHNTYEYNGIKIFGADGYKLSDAQEEEIEDILLDHSIPQVLASAEAIGTVNRRADCVEDYVSHIASAVPEGLGGLRVLADCANGSAARTAARLFSLIGADADLTACMPDGVNVNRDCGSTRIQNLCGKVCEGGYALGVAFDGDADRCLAVDEKGNVVDGDQIMAVLAQDMKMRGRLNRDTLAVTVMSNLGLFQFAERSGIAARTTKVGDRYVLEAMRREGLSLGGEQSGHIIFSDMMTTGDGQLSAVRLMEVMHRTGKPLSELCSVVKILPQVLLNMEATVDMKARLAECIELTEAVRRCEEELGGKGRILIRPSGTEPLIRVMVEGEDPTQIDAIAHRVADAIRINLA